MRARNFLRSSAYHFELTVSRKISKMLTVSRKKSSPHLDPLPLKGKFQASTWFEPVTSVTWVQRSTNWANKPTGRLPIRSLAINPWSDDSMSVITRVIGSYPAKAWIFFRRYFQYCLGSVHSCEDRFRIHLLNRSSHIWFSYVHSH